MDKLRVFRGEGAFDRAAAAKTDGLTVCGVVLKGGAPAYFLTPVDAEPAEIQDAAFRIREGRPIGDGERSFIEAAQRRLASA